ncbi:patellin-4-like [Canna indica]|uniref:Patellin-4-like n=1 Tax=Canna indica TaxID=4628 RepID=A0AAQ3L2E1_9LILI|nr:patellin-4-like [Canna indica]
MTNLESCSDFISLSSSPHRHQPSRDRSEDVPIMDDNDLEAFPDTSVPSPHDLKPCEKTSLLDLRTMLEESIVSGDLLKPPPRSRREKSRSRVASSSSLDSLSLPPTNEEEEEKGKEKAEAEEDYEDDLTSITLWGIPLSPSKNHEGTDVILVKFLQAREFKAADAFDMLRKTLTWRRQFKVDALDTASDVVDDDEAIAHLKSAAYIDGRDREGNPVCYNIYGMFKDKEVYRKTFGSQERRRKFMMWRVKLMEQGVQQMSLKPGGAAAILNIIDFKDILRPGMKELRNATREVVSILQDNYPEFVAKNIFLNVSFRYYAYHALFSPFITPRTRSKFIFARPSKVTETLLKFITPENIPIQYGGLKREDDTEFSAENGKASEMFVRSGCTSSIEIPITEPGVTAVWDIAVVGWEVNYKEEFIPEDLGSYKILIQKEKKMEECARNSFYINEPGKVVITIDNRSYKRKRVFYRSKTKPTVPLYNLLENQTHRPTHS